MANEIDGYLFKKLVKDVEEVEGKNFHGRFQNLILLLKGKAPLEVDVPSEHKWRRIKLYELSHILDEYRTCTEANLAGSVSLRLDKIEKELTQSSGNQGQDSKEADSPQDVAEFGRSLNWRDFFSQPSQAANPSKVYGFRDELYSLTESLFLESPFKATAVVGVGGAGKTTLCQQFYNSEEVRRFFVPRVWVSMPTQPLEGIKAREALLMRLVTRLGVDETAAENRLNQHGLGSLLNLLHQQLLGKRYLVILDNAWDKNEWYRDLGSWIRRGHTWEDRLAYGLPKGHGGTVIVTSRNEEAAKGMVGADNLHQLRPLQDEESCWLIFKDAAEQGKYPLKHSNVLELRKEIRQKCSGLPLAAKLMGQMVNQKLSLEGAPADNNGEQ